MAAENNVLNQIPFEEYYSAYIQKGKRKGDEYQGLCPFHDDSVASFSVNVTNGLWKCHAGCGGGNITQFHAKIKGMSTKEAYKDLLNEYNLSSPSKTKKKKSASSELSIPAKIVEAFQTNMSEKVLTFLKEKRGWSDKIIKKYRLGYNSKIKRVTIPVYDQKGICRNIRQYTPNPPEEEKKIWSWKTGYGSSRLYPVEILKQTDPDIPVIICEGEPDALCGLSHGLPCITQTAGAGNWEKRFNRYFKGRHVIIIYDNDEPGRKGTKKVVKNLKKVAAKIEVLQWPDWMNEGQDLTDWFVTHGKTKEELIALPRKEIEVTPEPEDGIKVFRKDGAYWKSLAVSEAGPVDVKISNFTLRICKTFQTPEGVIRSVKLIHEKGRESKEIELLPEAMASKFNFAKWCFSQGNYIWTGAMSDLEQVWRIELALADDRIITRPDHIGWIQDAGIWLFADHAIKDGKVYFPDEDHVIWVGDEGYQPISVISGDQDLSSPFLPMVRYDLSQEIAAQTRNRLIELLPQNLGSFHAYLVLGYVAMCAYIEEIHPEFQTPILFIYGKRQCGKNTLSTIVTSHFGLNLPENLSQITPAALSRRLSYYSSIPVWMDEYRNEKDCQRHDSTLRSCYDRIGTSRGKLGFGLVSYCVRAPLILTGEHFPADNALASRCVQVYLSTIKRQDEIYREIRQLLPMLSNVFHWICREKTPGKAKDLIAGIHDLKDLIESEHKDPRMAGVYAALGMAFMKIYDPNHVNGDHAEFMEWLGTLTHDIKEEKEEGFVINEFFSDIEVMKANKTLNGQHVAVKQLDGREVVCIWLKATYNAWCEDRRRRNLTVWDYGDVQRYLKDEPYFLKLRDNQRIHGAVRSCLRLDLKKMTEEQRNIFTQGWESSTAGWE